MSRKLSTPIVLLFLLSLMLSACAPAVTPTPAQAPTEAPVPTKTSVPPTATLVPPTPEPAPDAQALWTDLLAQIPADKGYGSVGATKLNEELVENPPFLLDVREAAELEKNGYIEGAVHIPVRDVLKNLDKLPAKDEAIVVYCGSGHRGGFVLSALRLLGYENVRNLGGGLGAWVKADLPVEKGLPEAAPAGEAPEIENQALFTMLDGYLSNLPEGFYSTNAEGLNTLLTEAKPFLLDVRPAAEVEQNGYIEGSVNIEYGNVFASLDKLPAKDAPIVVYCASGHRGAIIQMGLQLMGYEDVKNLGGGLNAWKAGKFPVEGWADWNANFGDYLENLPSNFSSISAADLNAELVEKAPFLLDIREVSEVEEGGYIEGAVNIPVRDVLKNLDKLPAQDQPIVVYCGSGHRGGLLMPALQMLGYEDVRNLGGGLGAWKKANLPVVMGVPEPAAAGTVPEVDQTMFKALDAYLSALPKGFNAISAADLNAALADASAPFVLDVRSAEELAADGMIEGSVNIPVKELFTRLSELPESKSAPIVVMCKSGHRGAIAMIALQMNGYTDVRNLGGGINSWIAAKLPVAEAVAP
jgi:rhodanese-related sulfurtransferase